MEKKNPSIALCRVFSMVLILLCHTVRFYIFVPGHMFLGQILNVGVFSFIGISGYLYGSRTITDFRGWFAKRFRAIVFPVVVFSAAVILAELFSGFRCGLPTLLLYLTNLQGLAFLFPKLDLGFTEIEILGPLWFTTVIMLCYGLVPLLQKLRGAFSGRTGTFLLAGAALTLLSFYIELCHGILLIYFVTFLFGYFMSALKWEQELTLSRFSVLTGLMALFQIIRLVLHATVDGSMLYVTYASVSHMVLGLWILLAFLFLGRTIPNRMDTLARSKLVTFCDGISFYVFLLHCCFCRGRFNVYVLIDNLLLSTLAFVLLTLLGALALQRTVQGLQKLRRP